MDTASLLQAIYRAYRENRLADMLGYLGEDFRYILHLPATVVPGGSAPRNKVETEAVLRHLQDTYDFLAYDPGPIIAADDKATVQPHVRLRDKRTGQVLETKITHTWRVRDGKATELEERHDLAKIDAFLKRVSDHGA